MTAKIVKNILVALLRVSLALALCLGLPGVAEEKLQPGTAEVFAEAALIEETAAAPVAVDMTEPRPAAAAIPARPPQARSTRPVSSSSLGERLKTFWMLEAIAVLDNLMTPTDSDVLGPKDVISGLKEDNLENQSTSFNALANLGNPLLDRWISRSHTQALIVWKDGDILHESYAESTTDGSNINGLSMAKTITALLIGIAIDRNLIGSEEDSISIYLPEIKLGQGETITIRDLLQQQSGMRDDIADVRSTLKQKSLESDLDRLQFGDDKLFAYSNVNYHLLSLILKRVYKKELNQIISEKLWQPLNLENAEVINSTGYCCIFASARSWLAIGELFLNNGVYQDQTIVSKSWLDKMRNDKVEPESFVVQLTSRSNGNTYSYHIFGGLDAYPNMYWSEGMGLQLILIDPDTQTIVVRLGDIPSAFRFNSNRWDDKLVSDLLTVVSSL